MAPPQWTAVRRAILSAAAVLMFAVVAGSFVGIGFSIALGAAGAFVVVSLFGLSPDSAPRGPSPRSYRWMPFAWLLLFLVSDHQFDLSRSPLDAAAGLASVSNVIELAAYGAIALLVAVTWNRYYLSTSVLPRWGPLVVLPLLAILSTLWSVIPEFTLVRSVQLLIPLALSVLLGKVWMSEPELGRESWGKTCRCLVVVVAVLVNLGLIFSSVTAGLHKGRFTWPGMHPVHAGVIIGAALLILLVGGRSFSRFPVFVHWTMVGLFGVALYMTQTRVALAAFAIALFISLFLPPRPDVSRRYLTIIYYCGAALMAYVFGQQAILAYLARGEAPDVFSTLNGRVPLWGVALDEVSQAARWASGFGYGSPRVVLFTRVDWAGTAHSAWIELLLGLGVLGSIIVAIVILRIGFRCIRLALDRFTIETRVAASLFVFLLVESLTTPGFVLPGFDYTLLCLVYALVVGLSQPERRPMNGWFSEDWSRDLLEEPPRIRV